MLRKKHTGERKLLLAFDVGAAYSGISYSILVPDHVPEVQGVHKFPGQELAGGNAKIPSVLYYDKNGKVRAAGAETERDGMDIIAEEENWDRAEWFKLHLRPKTKEFATGPAKIPDLPPNKTVLDVFSDYFEYLNDCAKQWIKQTHPGIGTSVWEGPEIHYILSHPNGWEGPQQAVMKQAAERAGLITPEGRNKITFITEGEASLNHCIEKGLMSESIRKGEGVSLVDAGNGMIDLSAYAANPDGKTFQEIAEAQCHLKGSIFVTEAAGVHLHEILKGSRFVQDIDEMKRSFDRSTKWSFRDPSEPYFIRGCGSLRDRDARLKITAGKLRLEGSVIASFFEPSISCIINGVLEQRRTAHKPISSVVLIGSFSASDYLFKRVKHALEVHGIKVFRPDTHLNKVIPDGSISFILNHPVRSRVLRHTLGIEIWTDYQPHLADHQKRKLQCSELYSGKLGIPGVFSIILPKNTQVKETQEFRCRYRKGSSNPLFLKTMDKEIIRYRGDRPQKNQQFMDEDPDNYSKVCTIKANLANIPLPPRFGSDGIYYEIVVDIVLLFGATELKAQVAWMENVRPRNVPMTFLLIYSLDHVVVSGTKGVEKRGDAEIIYETD